MIVFNFVLFHTRQNYDDGARLLSDVAGGLVLSSDNPLDFHDEIWSLLLIFVRYLYIGWKSK